MRVDELKGLYLGESGKRENLEAMRYLGAPALLDRMEGRLTDALTGLDRGVELPSSEGRGKVKRAKDPVAIAASDAGTSISSWTRKRRS